jgi:hypothetical protein
MCTKLLSLPPASRTVAGSNDTESTAELTMGQWVMGQMGRLKLMGHMGHGSEGVDP